MDNNLDVWVIQYHPEDLKSALEGLKDEGTILLFSNALCKFDIGGVEIKSRQFDTFLYSEENDLLVLLMRGGKATINDMREELDKQKVNYQEIVLAPDINEYEDGNLIPQVWIVRDADVLEEALKDVLKSECVGVVDYYPNLEGKLELDYVANDDLGVSNLNCRLFKGLVQLEDRIIMMVYQENKKNFQIEQVYKLIKQCGLDCNVIESGMPAIIMNEKTNHIR